MSASLSWGEYIAKNYSYLAQEETSSPIPEEWVQEIQKALDGWRDAVFIQDVRGLLKEKSRQKISKQ